MRQIVLLLAISGAAFGQSMLEAGGIMAGSAVGSAAGKKLSDGVNKTLRKTGNVLDTASKTGAKQAKASSATTTRPGVPMLQVSAGVPKAEVNNVPPPPPLRSSRPKATRTRTVSVPMVMSSVIPKEPPPPLNVDLSGIARGMGRDNVLALGAPSARITMYEDGHIVEIYQYRNETLASGTVRLLDGSVSAVEARP